MAATHFPIQIDGTNLQFEQHKLPISTAKHFWIDVGRERDLSVNIFLRAAQGNTATYQIVTQTAEATDQLVGELFAKTDAKLTLAFGEITPNADGVTFKLPEKNVDTFNRYVVSHLLSKGPFDVTVRDDEIQFICTHQGTEEEKVEQTREILSQLGRKIDLFVIEGWLKAYGDKRFEIDFEEPRSVGPSRLMDPN